MDNLKLNTPLTISEIDFRVQSINNGGYATILAYKDARVDMNRLDSVYGVGYWQRKHEVINGKEFCSVGIWNKDIQQWVWVQDCGTESQTEKEKGQSSDAFKRACFNLGIGRELYDYPIIQIKLEPNEFKIEGGKSKATWELKLKEWTWFSEFKDGKLTYLACRDNNGKARYKFGERSNSDQQRPSPTIKKEGDPVKPKVTDVAFQKILDRINSGELGVYEKAIESCSFDEEQRRMLDQANKNKN